MIKNFRNTVPIIIAVSIAFSCSNPKNTEHITTDQKKEYNKSIVLENNSKSTKSSTDKSCDEFLTQKIVISKQPLPSQDVIKSEFFRFIQCTELDSVDLQVLGTATGTQILMSLNKPTATYNDLLKAILKKSATQQYQMTREIVIVSNELSIKRVNIEKWEIDSKPLIKLGFEQKVIDELLELAKRNAENGWTYRELLEYYKKQNP